LSVGIAQAQETSGPSWRNEIERPTELTLPPEIERPEFEFSVKREQLMQIDPLKLGDDAVETVDEDVAEDIVSEETVADQVVVEIDTAEVGQISAPIAEAEDQAAVETTTVVELQDVTDNPEIQNQSSEILEDTLAVEAVVRGDNTLDSSPIVASNNLTVPEPLDLPEILPTSDQIKNNNTPYRLVRLSAQAPEFPKKARMNRTEGWVDLAVTVEPDGRISEVKISDAKPRRVFEKSAIRAVNKWKFAPPAQDGITTAMSGTFRVEFVLSD